MTKTSTFSTILGLSLLLAGIGCSSQEATAPEALPQTKTAEAAAPSAPTAQQVLDVFSARCMPCHATGTPKDGLALDNIDGVLKGSESGSVITAGNGAESAIVQHMRGANGKKKMPPMGTPATEEEIKTVEDWINAGANK